MSDEPRDRSTDTSLDPDRTPGRSEPESTTPDPNDEIPVPVAMFPAEVDERAQVVEALREREGKPDDEAPPAEPPAA